MQQLRFLLIAFCCALAVASRAQDETNVLKTEIQNFETQTDTVIVKGFSQIGSMTVDAGVISIRCKESMDIRHNRKQYGMTVEFEKDQQRNFLMVDYDEMDSLLDGMDYLSKINYSVTTLQGFDATFTTKSGLRLAAHSERRQGGIKIYVQFGDTPRIPITSDQLAQFQKLIGQAKESLDALKSK